MNKRLEDYKKRIQSVLNMRINKFALKQDAKIELVKQEDLSDLFSMLSFSSNEKLSELKAKLNGHFSIDDEIEELNNELLNIAEDLECYKRTCLNEMTNLEKKAGNKVSITKNNRRIKIAEKVSKRYVNLCNTVTEIDKLIEFVKIQKNEKVVCRYQINKEDVSSLQTFELLSYYTSLAALIMCEDIINPEEVMINRNIVVNKEDVSSLLECYNGYRQAIKSMRKESKYNKFKNRIEKAFASVKNFADSLLGRQKDSEVSINLRKSILLASLSLGVLCTSISFAKEEINKSDAITGVLAGDMNTVADLLMANSSDKNIVDSTLSSDLSTLRVEALDNSSIAPISAANKMTSNAEFLKAASTNAMIYSNSNAALYQEDEVISLEDKVEENAYEIVELVSIEQKIAEESSEEEVDEEAITDEELALEENEEILTSEIEAEAVVPAATSLDIANNDIFAEFTDETLEEVSDVAEPVEIDPDEVIKGFHLTFNNPTYDFSMDELKYLYYVVNHEYNGTYIDAMGIVSLVVNRLEDPRFPDNLIDILSAPDQFVVWDEVVLAVSKYDDDFMMNENIYNALNDVLNRGIRNCDYVEFKAPWTGDYSITNELKYQLVEDGNKFHNLAIGLARLNDDEEAEEVTEQENEYSKRRDLTL